MCVRTDRRPNLPTYLTISTCPLKDTSNMSRLEEVCCQSQIIQTFCLTSLFWFKNKYAVYKKYTKIVIESVYFVSR